MCKEPEAIATFSETETNTPFAPNTDEAAGIAGASNRFAIIVAVAACLFSLAYWAGYDMTFAMDGVKIWKGQYWRFILSCLLHVDPIHLLFNLYWFVGVFAPPIELRYGWRRSLLLFFVLAIGSGGASFLLGEGGIGLSGVAYGYFGLILVAGTAPRGPQVSLEPRTTLVMLAWFALCIYLTETGVWAVGNVAHGAGLIIGAALGLALRTRVPRRWILLVSVAALGLAPATLYMPWDYRWQWQRGYEADNPAEAEAAFRRTIDTAGDDRLVQTLLLHMGRFAICRDAPEEAVAWYKRAMDAAAMPEQKKWAEINMLFAGKQLKRAHDMLVDFAQQAEDPDIRKQAISLLHWVESATPHLKGESAPKTESPTTGSAPSAPE